MKRKESSLFFGCLGNGTTVCDTSVMERGDYKRIAHISEDGQQIRWYVSRDRCSDRTVAEIEAMAKRVTEKHVPQKHPWEV